MYTTWILDMDRCEGPMFSVAIFLSAFLLFIAQPLLAKKLLPWFGGSPTVWLSIVLFFQTTLLIGYFYAFLLTKLKKVSVQTFIHLGLLSLSLLFIPMIPLEALADGNAWPPVAIFKLLCATSLLPIVLISTSSPLLQHWYSHAYQTDFPYRYYALSNLGSLLGLLVFPFLIEPFFGLTLQFSMWAGLYCAYFLASGICIALIFRQKEKRGLPDECFVASSGTPLIKTGSWLLLAMMSCTLLMTTTQWMMQNVVSFPLLWIIPLTLYLLSFIITFSYPKAYIRSLWYIIYSSLAVLVLVITSHHQLLLHLQLIIYPVLIFSGCMICHGELFNQKPDKDQLTYYYLMIALGGVFGGLFVNLIGPLFFNEWWDFYFALIGISLYVAFFVTRSKIYKIPALAISVALCVLMGYQLQRSHEDVIAMVRNFFGKSDIVERKIENRPYQRQLRNGNIIHGHQYLDPIRRVLPTTYYGKNSGLGLAINFQRQFHPHLKIGVIGLGTGTIAALTEHQDFIRFYEIDPDMEHIARNYFYYLYDSLGDVDVVIGDGRMLLDRARKQNQFENYDLLVVDAFNGDAIPLHLVTQEAMEVYLSQLGEKGLLLFHISSRYLSLYPQLQALASANGVYAYLTHNQSEDKDWVFSSEWVVISRQTDIGVSLYNRKALVFNSTRSAKVWTDDYNTLLSAIRW